jgi:hypothetical protein
LDPQGPLFEMKKFCPYIFGVSMCQYAFQRKHRPACCLVADGSILAAHRFPNPRTKTVQEPSAFWEKHGKFITWTFWHRDLCPCMPSTCGFVRLRNDQQTHSQPAGKTGHWQISEVDQNSWRSLWNPDTVSHDPWLEDLMVQVCILDGSFHRKGTKYSKINLSIFTMWQAARKNACLSSDLLSRLHFMWSPVLLLHHRGVQLLP